MLREALVLFCSLLCRHCSAIVTGQSTSKQDIEGSSSDFTPNEMVNIEQEISSPSNDTLWCDHEAHQYRDILPHGIVKCGKNNTPSVLIGYCLTIDETDILEAGNCLYNYNTYHNTYNGMYKDLPRKKSKLNDFMCGIEELNRTGTLCGKCQDGYYPLAYSYDMTCVQCPNGKSNWWKFALAAFLPLTIFCIVILFFKINIVSSRFQGFLFYSQIVSTPATIRVFIFLANNYSSKSESKAAQIALRSFATFYGIWNLDFFRSVRYSICLGTDTLETLALDFIAVGVYPLLLLVLSYVMIELYDRNVRLLVIMWKPFHRIFGLFKENWDLRTSLIDAFATFLHSPLKWMPPSKYAK